MEIIIRAPSLEEEMRRVAHLQTKKEFYQEHGYNAAFPDGDLEKVFDKKEYERGVQKIEAERKDIEQIIKRMEMWEHRQLVVLPRALTIVPTKYGVGGSFDTRSARIVVMMLLDGSFVKPVLHLVIHELLHIVTDMSYAQRFKFSHRTNERFIDLLCRDVFGDVLTDYRMQPMGDATADDMLQKYIKDFV